MKLKTSERDLELFCKDKVNPAKVEFFEKNYPDYMGMSNIYTAIYFTRWIVDAEDALQDAIDDCGEGWVADRSWNEIKNDYLDDAHEEFIASDGSKWYIRNWYYGRSLIDAVLHDGEVLPYVSLDDDGKRAVKKNVQFMNKVRKERMVNDTCMNSAKDVAELKSGVLNMLDWVFSEEGTEETLEILEYGYLPNGKPVVEY